MKYNSCWSYENNNKGFKSNKPSLAVPGQAYSIPQVIERLRAGLPVQVLRSGFNPDGFPKYDDLTSLDAFKAMLKNKESKINERIQAIKDKNKAVELANKAEK